MQISSKCSFNPGSEEPAESRGEISNKRILNTFSVMIHSTYGQFLPCRAIRINRADFRVIFCFLKKRGRERERDSRRGVCVVTHFKRWREAKLRAALSLTVELYSRRVRSHGMSFCNFLFFLTILLRVLFYLWRPPPRSYFLVSRSGGIVRKWIRGLLYGVKIELAALMSIDTNSS